MKQLLDRAKKMLERFHYGQPIGRKEIDALFSDLDKAIAEYGAVEAYEQEVYCPTCGSCGVDGCCSPTKCERVRCLYGEDCVESYRKAIEEAETLSDENAKLKLVVDAARMVLDGEPHPQYNPDGSSKVAPQYIIDTLQVAIALLDGKEPNA